MTSLGLQKHLSLKGCLPLTLTARENRQEHFPTECSLLSNSRESIHWRSSSHIPGADATLRDF